MFNVTTILRQDIGVSETQRHLNPAGFRDAYAYEIQKATKRLAIKLEKMVFAASGASTNGANGVARQMKSFQDFIVTNAVYAGTVSAKKLDGTTAGYAGSVSQAGSLSAFDFNNMLDLIYGTGGNPEQCYVSRKVKRQISNFNVGVASTTPQNRNIAAVDKKLVSAIDFYDSDFGLIQIVLDRWIPESANASDAAGQTDISGQIFFLQRSLNRLAWLRPMAHSLVGKRGDSVAGIIVGEVTLEVLNEKGNGRILGVNNKSMVT